MSLDAQALTDVDKLRHRYYGFATRAQCCFEFQTPFIYRALLLFATYLVFIVVGLFYRSSFVVEDEIFYKLLFSLTHILHVPVSVCV